ncbi:hypothetical protein cce_1936 [Crocosphaera subtropica ATCC 51142]|uniref:Uncharacterized protein n=1 Tax=Crocosphaera subtropica (strain ATCC 51142 / BH68) TaxID=43989 RepID=B1X0J7_CROS5|nr:hypothetical protein [Crocosphaera subtropica]ACB51286.1 hypothetical protein cce_1936 [Crocosphaera subtropica ATCC 51142]
MTTQLNLETNSTAEQIIVFPGCYHWQQFKTIQSIINEQSTAKIS